MTPELGNTYFLGLSGAGLRAIRLGREYTRPLILTPKRGGKMSDARCQMSNVGEEALSGLPADIWRLTRGAYS